MNGITGKINFREKYPNIAKLTDYINQQNRPALFMCALFSMAPKDMGGPVVHGEVQQV